MYSEYDGELDSFDLTTTGIEMCGKGSKLLLSPAGTIVRFALYCHSWNCQRCADERRDKVYYPMREVLDETDNLYFCEAKMLNKRNAQETVAQRIRREGGSYMLATRTRGQPGCLLTNAEITSGREGNLSVHKLVGYADCHDRLCYSLRWPHVSRVSFGGAAWRTAIKEWRKKNEKPKRNQSDEWHLVIHSMKLTQEIVAQVMAAISGTLANRENEWQPPQGVKPKAFARLFRREIDRQKLVQAPPKTDLALEL